MNYWLLLVIALTSPLVVLLLFLHMVLRLRAAFYRLCVLRRAAKWKLKEPRTRWPKEEWHG